MLCRFLIKKSNHEILWKFWILILTNKILNNQELFFLKNYMSTTSEAAQYYYQVNIRGVSKHPKNEQNQFNSDKWVVK